MNNELYIKISEERITDPSKLSAAEQTRLKSDAEALLAIQENQAMANLSRLTPPPPNREVLLSTAISDQSTVHMPVPYSRVWSRVARGAAAVALVTIAIVLYNVKPIFNGDELAGIALSPAQPAWASKPGVLMEFDTQTDNEELARAIADSVDAKLRESMASQYFNLQSVHGELAYNRDLLRGHQVYLESIGHSGRSSVQLDKDLQLKHEELMQLLELHGEKLEQAQINSRQLSELAEKHVGQLETELEQLSAELANLHIENFRYLRRDISRDDRGNCVITLALPPLAIEFSDVRSRLGELKEIENVRLENAVFFVREGNEEFSGPEDSLFGKMEHIHHGEHDSHFTTVSTTHASPHPEIVEAGLKNVLFFGDGDSEIHLSFEGTNGHSSVILQRGGELIEKLESRSMGRDLVWYGLPENEELHRVELNQWHTYEGEPAHEAAYQSFVVKMNADVELDHMGAVFMTAEGMSGEVNEIQTSISIPGLVSLGELDGKIISVIGDAGDSQDIEVITETVNGTKVLKVVVDGEVIKILKIENGDVEVVVAHDNPLKSETDTEPDDK